MRTQDAKRIRLEDLLSTLGFLPVKTAKAGVILWYNSPFRTDKDPSFKVNTKINTWYDFGNGEGGNILDFLIRYENTDLKGALSLLDGLQIREFMNSKVAQYLNSEVKIKKVQPLENAALITYLQERKINPDIAKLYLQEIYYIANKKHYFAVAMQNDSGGFEIRNKYFKGGVKTKDITTKRKKENVTQVSVFEGFIDFLSILTEQNIEELKSDTIILNSTSQIDLAIDKIALNQYDKIFAFLDNDEAGKEALKKLQSTYPNTKDLSYLYADFNDPNEKLCS